MSWLKKIFGFKEKVQEPVIPEPVIPERVVWKQCHNCKKPIYEDEGYSKQLGNYYHRKCWKSLVKAVWSN